VTLAAAAIGLLPFARVARLAGERRAAAAGDAEMIRQLRWAVEAVARRAPFRAKCFECGLAAHWMLRRRGIASTLFYGIARNGDGGLAAHVWVRAGAIAVTGCENAGDFTVVAQFPPESEDQTPLPS
jgi:hypothetical protein